MSKKIHDLEIRQLLEVDETGELWGGMGYFSKGHHDKDMFFLNVLNGWGETIESAQIKHGWFRKVPVAQGRSTKLIAAKPNTRGSFPETIYEY